MKNTFPTECNFLKWKNRTTSFHCRKQCESVSVFYCLGKTAQPASWVVCTCLRTSIILMTLFCKTLKVFPYCLFRWISTWRIYLSQSALRNKWKWDVKVTFMVWEIKGDSQSVLSLPSEEAFNRHQSQLQYVYGHTGAVTIWTIQFRWKLLSILFRTFIRVNFTFRTFYAYSRQYWS